MSGADAEVFNNLERAVSADLNDLQAIEARFLSELMRYGQVLRIGGFQPEAQRNVVFGGLTVVPNGANVDVTGGVLGQLSAGLAPVPGPLDSPYRLSRNDVSTNIVMPAPGVTTFYLIEAQMAEVIALSAMRDIYNPGTGFFTPALVTKQTRRTIVFQLLAGAGGQAPAPTGGDWVPIAIVRRPAGGGPVVATDIDDVRPLAEWGRVRPALPEVRSGKLEAIEGSSVIRLHAAMDGNSGLRSADIVNATIDPTVVQVLSPTTVLAANTWYYLYLASWSALSLNPRYADGILSRQGVLVLSDVVPNSSRTNTAPIALPAPYGVTPAPAIGAYLVCALRRNAANTGWVSESSDDLEHFHMGGGPIAGVEVRALAPVVAGANVVVPVAGSLPTGYRGARLRVAYFGASATAGFSAANVRNLSLRDAASAIFLDPGFATPLETAGGAPQPSHAYLPKQFGTDTFDLFVGGAAVDVATSVSIILAGFDI